MRNEFSCESMFEKIMKNMKLVKKIFVRYHDDSNEVS